jgi:hypothetical protein
LLRISRQILIRGVALESSRCFTHCRGYSNGHRGIWLERGQDNLLSNFQINTKMYHDISVSFYEHSTAFVNGTGKVRTNRCGIRMSVWVFGMYHSLWRQVTPALHDVSATVR